jgi:hypothetical protein
MKKRILITLVTCFCFTMVLASGVAAATQESSPGWSPVKFCLWPGVWGIPEDKDIYGLNFGLCTYGHNDNKIIGLDFAPLLCETDNVIGAQISLVNVGKNGEGFGLGVGNIADNFTGFHIGIWNHANDSKLVQFGFYNDAQNSHGFQIGFMNLMDDGFLPVFPFFNFSVSK